MKAECSRPDIPLRGKSREFPGKASAILRCVKQEERIDGFVRCLHSWYVRHRRELPWRDLSEQDPNVRAYHVLVSEVMLQQTQVPRVAVKYKEFIQRFPCIAGLAEASNAEILLAWRGMGYNSRALRLRDAARIILKEHHGQFPTSMAELLSIKGIGPYTAAAIRNFAFELPTALIDTNVRRILHRAFIGPEKSDGTFRASDRSLIQICDQLLSHWVGLHRKPSGFFSALMDYGSLVQTKRSPAWDRCVLTAGGIMKATKRNMVEVRRGKGKGKGKGRKSEPGRMIGGRFTPNRIVRGRIVEALRDHPQGLGLERIGRSVAIDWNTQEHRVWLQGILDKLMKEQLLHKKQRHYHLAS